MEPNETMVEENFDDTAADDALPEGIAEETDESEESLESFLGEAEEEDEGETPAEEPEEKPAQGTSEPGWIKKRVEKAVQKAVAETEARMQAVFEQQMAPIREKMIEDEAQELVRSRKVADIETARELVRLRKGMAPAAQPQEQAQPRQSNGQFAPREDPAETARTEARIEMLKHQATRIRSGNGPDVIAEFNSNPEIKQKVIAGEMDFYDVAETMKKSGGKKRPPSPTRSPNGANGVQPRSIENMTDAQFRKLDRMLDEGVRFTLKR